MQTSDAKEREPRPLLKPIALLAVLLITAITLTVSQLLTIRLQDLRHVDNTNFTASPNLTMSPPDTQPTRDPKKHPKKHPKKDLFFTPTLPTHIINATQPRSPPCIIFSCADVGYFLVEPHLRMHGAKFCDRLHFTGRTTDQSGKTVPAVWCRVALFRMMHKLFRRYKKIIYTDVDIIYDEQGLLQLRCGTGLKGVIVSTKVENRKTVLRIPWIVVCDRADPHIIQMVETWARKHREVYLRDQTVFNENWRCKHVTCYNHTIAQKAELRHCGSWLPKQDRLKCFQTR